MLKSIRNSRHRILLTVNVSISMKFYKIIFFFRFLRRAVKFLCSCPMKNMDTIPSITVFLWWNKQTEFLIWIIFSSFSLSQIVGITQQMFLEFEHWNVVLCALVPKSEFKIVKTTYFISLCMLNSVLFTTHCSMFELNDFQEVEMHMICIGFFERSIREMYMVSRKWFQLSGNS